MEMKQSNDNQPSELVHTIILDEAVLITINPLNKFLRSMEMKQSNDNQPSELVHTIILDEAVLITINHLS